MALLVALLCVTTAWTDFLYRKVSNVLLLIVMAGAACVLLLDGGAGIAPGQRVLGSLLAFAIMLPIYVIGRMGAGDVKFMAVAGFFVLPAGVLPIWVGGSLLALVHALFVQGARYAAARDWQFGLVGYIRVRIGMHSLGGAFAEKRKNVIPFAGYLSLIMLGQLIFAR